MSKKSATPAADDLDDLLDDLDGDLEGDASEEKSEPASKGKGKDKAAPAPAGSKKKTDVKKTDDKKKASDGEKKLEGLTKETEESKIITFKKGSGSSHLLQLIRKYGFDRTKVLAAAAKLKEAGKGFAKCDPAKKYGKVAGIIKNLQNAGYKLEA